MFADPALYADPARTFTALVLPWGGDGYCNVHWKRPDGTWAGQAFKDLDAMLRLLNWLERQPGVDVYVCMSSQRVATEKVGKNGRPYWRAERHVADAVELKSLFIDLDVKKGAYATSEEALAAFKAFLAASGMPRPMLMVASGGGGFHVHWLFNPALPPDLWMLLAKALKNACKVHDLITDEAVTTDAARILRVPGTLNYKYAPPRTVGFHGDVLCNNYPAEYLEGVLAPYAVIPGIITPQISAPGAPTIDAPGNLNRDLTAGIDFKFGDFVPAAWHVAGISPSPWALEDDGGVHSRWRDFMFACVFIEITFPAHAEDTRKLFAYVMAKVGRIPEKNWGNYKRAFKSTAARLAEGREVVRPGTIFQLASDNGWTPPSSGAGSGAGAARIPLTEDQKDALALAKARVAAEYHAGAAKSRDVARSRAAKFALHTIGDSAVRAALAPKIVVLMAPDGWAPGELIDVGTACGLSRDEARRLAAWALARMEQGNIA